MLSIKEEKVVHAGPSWLEQVGQRKCEWCSVPDAMKQELPYYVDKPLAEWPREWLLDLKYCDDCVVEYHRIKDDLLERMPDYKLKLQKADIGRLTDSITEALEKAVDRKPFGPSLQEDPDEIVTKLHVPLLEILRFPYLLHHEKLSLQFVQGLITLLCCGCPLMLEEKHSGVYLLLVHPDPEVRSWAVRQVRALGLINTDDYDFLQDVISWLVSVVEFNLFDYSNFIAEENNDSTLLPLSFLPMHLFSHLTVRQYWLGLFIILRQMDVPTVQTRFMGSTGHRNILSTTVSVMEHSSHNEEESAFWPTLQCLVVFLERLGSHIWLQFSSFKCSPDRLFSIITEHPLYRNTIKQWDSSKQSRGKPHEKAKHMDGFGVDETAVNLSQNVGGVSSSLSTDRSNCTGRLYKTTFAWFQPFVQSLLDFESGGRCVSRVIEYLHCTAAGSSPGKPLWFEVQSALLPIIYELLRECIYPLLTPTVRLWILDVVDVAFFAVKTTDKVQSLVATTQRLLLQLLKLVHKLGHREALKYIPVYTTGKLSAGDKEQVISLVVQTLEAKDLQSDLQPLWKTSSESSDVLVNEDKKGKGFIQEKKEMKCSTVKEETKSYSKKSTLDWMVEPLKDKGTWDSKPSTSAKHSHLASSHEFDINVSLNPLGRGRKTPESAMESRGKSSTDNQASLAYESKLHSCNSDEEHWVKPKAVMKKTIENPGHSRVGKTLESKQAPLVPLKDIIKPVGGSTTLMGKKSNHGRQRFRKTLERKQQLFQPIVPLMDIMKQKIGSPFSLSAQQFRVKDGRAVIPPGIEKRGKATDQKATQEAAIKQKQLIARKPAGRLMKPETALEGRGSTSADPIVLSDDDDDDDDIVSDAGTSEESRPQDAIVNNKQPTSIKKEEEVSYFDNNEEDVCDNDLVQGLEDFESSQSDLRDSNGYLFNLSQSLTRSGKAHLKKPAAVGVSVLKVMSSGDDDDSDDDDNELLCSVFRDRNKTEFSSSEEFTKQNGEAHTPANPGSERNIPGSLTELRHSSERGDDLKKQLFDVRENSSFVNYLGDKGEKTSVDSNSLNFHLVEAIHPDSNKEPDNLEGRQLGEPSLAGISNQLENDGTVSEGTHVWDELPLDVMWSSQENALASVEEDLEDIYSVTNNSGNNSFGQPNADNVSVEVDMEIDDDQDCKFSPQPYFDTGDVPVTKTPFFVEGSSKQGKKFQKCVTFQEPPIQGRIVERGAKSMAPPQPKAASTKPSRALTEDDFLHEILRWKVPVRQESRKRGAMPEMWIGRLKHVPYSFDSMDEYYETFRPLLFVELWEQMISGWYDKERNKKTVLVKVDAGCPTNNLWTVQCSGMIDKEQKDHAEFPLESDLVIVWLALGEREGVDVYQPFPVFGVVKKAEAKPITTQKNTVGRDRQNDAAGKGKFQLTLTIQTSLKFRPARQSRLKVDFVMSLLTSLRQWGGLMYFSKSLLAPDLLKPRNSRNFGIDDCGLPSPGPVTWNSSQQRVISTAATAVHHPYPIPRICLVQGPPGTGKSLTIVGLVTKILNGKSCEGYQQPGVLSSKFRILLCAPSNAAIDELIRKLAQANIRLDRHHDDKENRRDSRQGVARKDSIKNCGDLCLVRVGRRSHIYPAVMKFSLENMTKEVLNNAGVASAESFTEIRERLRKIDEEEKNIEDQIFRINASSLAPEDESVLKELEKKKKELTEIKRKLEKKRFTEKEDRQRHERRVRRSILADADIICTTLSGSGSSSLKQDFTGTSGNKFPFRCVIVDEACQSSELDLLIPLEFFSSKLVLVGDPEQLSATVKSAKARENLLGRSMFERLYRFFRKNKEMGKPVLMLDEQYRMHPEIAAFPSQHVYNLRLRSDSSLENRPFPLKKPYALFDVVNGLEICQEPGELWNQAEADLVTALCLKLTRILPVDSIGVITPYRRQKTEIQRRLVDNGITRGNATVEVNTVDGFQGREKDMIILSCVRAKSFRGSIGFVNDRQRMNVALTRARHALYIFGHMETLEGGSRDWKKLVEDASKRRRLYTARSSEDVQSVVFSNETVEDWSPAKDPRLKAKVDHYEDHARKGTKDQPWAGTSRGGSLNEMSSGDVHVSTVQKGKVDKSSEFQQSHRGSDDVVTLSNDAPALESSRRRSGDKRSLPEPEDNQGKKEKFDGDKWRHHERHIVNGEVHSSHSNARHNKACGEDRPAAYRHLQRSRSEEAGINRLGQHETISTTFLTSRLQETRHEVHHSSEMDSISSSAMPSSKTIPAHHKERSHARQEDFHHRHNTSLSATNRELGPDERYHSLHDHRKERTWEGRVDKGGDKWRPHENVRETSSDRAALPTSGRINLFASSATQAHSKRPKLDEKESLGSGQCSVLTDVNIDANPNGGFDADDHFEEDDVDLNKLSAIIKTRADFSGSYIKQLYHMEQRAAGNSRVSLGTSPNVQPSPSRDISFAIPHPIPTASTNVEYRMPTTARTVDRSTLSSAESRTSGPSRVSDKRTSFEARSACPDPTSFDCRNRSNQYELEPGAREAAELVRERHPPIKGPQIIDATSELVHRWKPHGGSRKRHAVVNDGDVQRLREKASAEIIGRTRPGSRRKSRSGIRERIRNTLK